MQAVCVTIKAEQKLTLAQIHEAEEYLGLLRQKYAMLDLKLQDTHNQIAYSRNALNIHGISEYYLSDAEDDTNWYPLPPSSDPTHCYSAAADSSGILSVASSVVSSSRTSSYNAESHSIEVAEHDEGVLRAGLCT